MEDTDLSLEFKRHQSFGKEKTPTRPKTGATINDYIFEITTNSIVDGLVLMDTDGVVQYTNHAAEVLLGAKRSVVGVDRKKLISSNQEFIKYKLEYLYDPLKAFKASLSGTIINGLLIKVNSDPLRYLDTTYTPIFNDQGKVAGILADFRDITVIKNQQDEITSQLSTSNNQKKRWEAIFNNVEEGICIVNENSRISDFNPALELMSGYSKEEVLGQKYFDVFKSHDGRGNPLGDSVVKKALITQEPVTYDEHLHINRDGEDMWVGETCVPIFSRAKQFECLIVIRDVNNYKQLEKLKSEFVSIASHELRTPLTIINGYLSLLVNGDFGSLLDSKNAAGHEKIINKVFLETKRLSALVEDLLNISRIEEGRLKIDFQKTSLNALIEEIASYQQLLAKSKNLELTFSEPGEDILVNCDPAKIKQVLTNLIDNAVKYTEKGSVTLTVKKTSTSAITTVKDTGIGITPKLKEKIFEKFQQAPGSYLKENKGNGLGLFIVKGIINLHQGEIWVTSDPQKGSTFSFSLPLIKDNIKAS